MLPQIPHSFDFIHFRDRNDLPHLILVIILVVGIGVGSYLALRPQTFINRASEPTSQSFAGQGLVELAFAPDTLQIQTGRVYEVKVVINPKGERVTAVSLSLQYDPAVVTIIETENAGFLPVTLKSSDDFNGNLSMVYGSTIDSQATAPGMVALIKFKANNNGPSRITMKGNTVVSVSSKEGNALSAFPVLELESGAGSTQTGEEDIRYPDSLLLEKAFHAEPEPFIRDFREASEPDPEVKPGRVEPGFSGAYVQQLGKDIFVEPVVALNQVLQEKATEILKPGEN